MVEICKMGAASVAPLVVVVDGISAGFALQEKTGLRFRAAHPRFEILDGSRFSRVEQLKRAALRLAKASRDRKSPHS